MGAKVQCGEGDIGRPDVYADEEGGHGSLLTVEYSGEWGGFEWVGTLQDSVGILNAVPFVASGSLMYWNIPKDFLCYFVLTNTISYYLVIFSIIL